MPSPTADNFNTAIDEYETRLQRSLQVVDAVPLQRSLPTNVLDKTRQQNDSDNNPDNDIETTMTMAMTTSRSTTKRRNKLLKPRVPYMELSKVD